LPGRVVALRVLWLQLLVALRATLVDVVVVAEVQVGLAVALRGLGQLVAERLGVVAVPEARAVPVAREPEVVARVAWVAVPGAGGVRLLKQRRVLLLEVGAVLRHPAEGGRRDVRLVVVPVQ